MSKKRIHFVIPLLGLLLAALIAGVLYAILSAEDHEPEPDAEIGSQSERERALAEQRRRLQQVLTTKRPPRKAAEPRQAVGDRPVSKVGQPVDLTPRQRVALKAALDRFYSPAGLADALRDRSAPDYARGVSHEYQQLRDSETLGDGRGSVPVTPEVDEVIKRMGVVRDYVMNMLHTLRPEGQEHMQQQMMDRMNESIGRRIDHLNSDYPFLDVQKVEEL
jgi:hypothetical protein